MLRTIPNEESDVKRYYIMAVICDCSLLTIQQVHVNKPNEVEMNTYPSFSRLVLILASFFVSESRGVASDILIEEIYRSKL